MLTQFTLSGILTLLEVVDAKETDRVRLSLDELNRSLFEKERERPRPRVCAQRGRRARAGLKPWREVILPHPDVFSDVAELASPTEADTVTRLGGSAEPRRP